MYPALLELYHTNDLKDFSLDDEIDKGATKDGSNSLGTLESVFKTGLSVNDLFVDDEAVAIVYYVINANNRASC